MSGAHLRPSPFGRRAGVSPASGIRPGETPGPLTKNIDLGHLLWRFFQENPEIGRFFQALGEFLQRLVGKSSATANLKFKRGPRRRVEYALRTSPFGVGRASRPPQNPPGRDAWATD